MKIAVLYDFLQTAGGAERVALTLAKHLNADLVTADCVPGLPERLGFSGVRVKSLGGLPHRPPVKHIAASARFARLRLPGYDFYFILGNWAPFAARRHHPNVYYCLTPTRMFYDQRDAILARLPWASRTIARPWTAMHRGFERRAVRHCDRIVAISENVRTRVRRFYDQDSEVIYPPVNTSRFHFEEVGESWLSVSRLYPEKRIDLQFEIFRRLPKEKLVIAGGHAAGDQSERYLTAMKAPANVTLLGEISDRELRDLYARCRGLIATAVDEDFGLTPLEAMASGKCVLATDEGGYRETIIPGKTGFLLPPDASRFAAKIRELDDSTLRSMRDACVMQARAFDETVFLEKMTALIAEASRNRSGIPPDSGRR